MRDAMAADPLRAFPDEPMPQVVRRMRSEGVGAVLAVDAPPARPALRGLLTERDLLRVLEAAGPAWADTSLGDWMVPDPPAIDPGAGWEDALDRMADLGVRYLPVIEDGEPIGLVSSHHLVGRRADRLSELFDERTRELREANEALSAREAELTHYLRAASRMQRGLLSPPPAPGWPGLDWAVHYAPLDHLGGDYYDFVRPSESMLGVMIADASGHSLPAAMVAVVTRTLFREVTRTLAAPGAVLRAMNSRLQGLSDGRFVTAFYGVIERDSWKFTYASAGHPPPALYRAADGSVEALAARGMMLGVVPDQQFAERSVGLRPGDRLALFTDGVTEARDGYNETYGSDRLRSFLATRHAPSASALLRRLLADVDGFRGGRPPADDITALVAVVRGDGP